MTRPRVLLVGAALLVLLLALTPLIPRGARRRRPAAVRAHGNHGDGRRRWGCPPLPAAAG